MPKNEYEKENGDTKLKTCPFCGGEAEMQIRLAIPKPSHTLPARAWVSCKCCGAAIVINEKEIKEAVAERIEKAWNHRAGSEGKNLVSIEDVLTLINDTGGCDAAEEYTRGWDAACDELHKRIAEMLPIV